jgi:hypothetical protein
MLTQMDRNYFETLATEAARELFGNVLSVVAVNDELHPSEAEYADATVEVEYMHPGLYCEFDGSRIISPGPAHALFGIERRALYIGGPITRKAVVWQS